MEKCDFCEKALDDRIMRFTRQEMLRLMSRFPVMGDFVKHYGFTNAILVKIYTKFESENADEMTLCFNCGDRLKSIEPPKKWFQFWK